MAVQERSGLRRGVGIIAALAATLVIVLAVLVGIARLLLPMVPQYHDDIRKYANAATGLDIAFGRVSASWPLQGPELRFFDVQVTVPSTGRRLLTAGEASLGINLVQWATSRRLLPGRVGLRKAIVRARRNEEGELFINGVPLADLLPPPSGAPMPRLDVDLRDIDLTLLDATRLVSRVHVSIEQLAIGLAPDLIRFDGEVRGEDGLADDLELSGSVPTFLIEALRPAAATASGDGALTEDELRRRNSREWALSLRGTGLDLARWVRLVGNAPSPLAAGHGDLEVELALTGTTPSAVTLDGDLAGVVLRNGVPGADATTASYPRIEGAIRWSRSGAGWDARVDRLVVQRDHQPSPAMAATARLIAGDAGVKRFELSGDVLRVADVWPIARVFLTTELHTDLVPEKLLGELREYAVGAELRPGAPVVYAVRARLVDAGIVMTSPGWAVAGITGELAADESAGKLALDARAGLVRLPGLFRSDLRTTRAVGTVSWKFSNGSVEFISDELRAATAEADATARLRVRFPRDDTPFVDLSMRMRSTSIPAALEFLPLQKLKPGIVEWLDRAIIAGALPAVDLVWQGPVRGVPYADGEGVFRGTAAISDAVLDYAPGWPRAEGLQGTLEMDGASLRSSENRGTLAGIAFQDADVRIANLVRNAIVEVSSAERLQLGQILNFLRRSPIAESLGPTLQSVTGSGSVGANVSLAVPIASPKEYGLKGRFQVDGARLGLRGIDYSLDGLAGVVRLDGTQLTAERVIGQFLDEPVSIALRAPGVLEEGIAQVAVLEGETPARKLAAAFSIPYSDELHGVVGWSATAEVPVREAGRPLQIRVESDLSGLQSTLPPPLAKASDEREAMQLTARFPETGRLDIEGRIARGVSWALRFEAPERQPWRLERGALRSGLPAAAIPATPGLEIAGAFDALRFEDWFGSDDGAAAGSGSGAGPLVRRIDIQVATFSIFGRQFADLAVDAERTGAMWRIGVDGPQALGAIEVPVDDDAAPVTLDLQRLWLTGVAPARDGPAADRDPRRLPSVRANVADFVLNDMHFGKLTAEMTQRGDGVIVEPLLMESAKFRIAGDAVWVASADDPGKQRSELRLNLQSSDLRSTLVALGYDPVVEGERGTAALDLFWAGGPSEDFLSIAGGRVAFDLDKGRFLSVEPGGGRLVGLLSLTALPRRLSLDFSDVLDEGLGFDEAKGEFRLEDGNAFTCNFGLQGPATDLGVVGRVDLRNRNYHQVAVVRPHVSDVIAIGSAVVGGPVVGGAVLLISQIFRKPLRSLGETYYLVEGPWEAPEVTKVQRSEIDITPFRDCALYLAEVLRELPPEAELER